MSTTYTPEKIRSMIYGLDTPVKGHHPAISLDNAATTPPFKGVIAEIYDKLQMYGSIGRGTGQKSVYTSEIYEHGRETVKTFLGLKPDDDTYTVIYTNSTTDGINKLASALVEDSNQEISIICTRMEHHANDLPWRMRLGIHNIFYAEVDEIGRLDINDIEQLLQENKSIKYVCVTAASNVTGYVNDVHLIAKVAHRYGAKIIVDGAQIVAHRQFNMLGNAPDENIDFFVFSAHKMYSPFGGGAIVGLTNILKKHTPRFWGGGMVSAVYDYNVDYAPLADLYEAGSPNYPGVVGMLKSMEILKDIGFDYIQNHELELMKRAIDGLKRIDGEHELHLYGDNMYYDDRVGIVVFNIGRFSGNYVSEILAEQYAIAVRHGKFCSHPYVNRLIKGYDLLTSNVCHFQDGMVRVSFGIYTTFDEVDSFVGAVEKIALGAEDTTPVMAGENRLFTTRGVRLPNDRG